MEATKRHWILIPVAFLYRIATGLRNKLFDWKILRSEEFDLPVISVGNLTVGGTGKTPHIEYLVNLLKDKHEIATLSRGYKRKTSGFRLSTADSTPQEIGDEPYQIKRKFPDIHVAVDANRCRGIHTLCKHEQTKGTEVILLDDAFQHRHVTPGINILLMDYNRPIYDDALLPLGRLREAPKGSSRAQIIIVTKCPVNIKPIDFRITAKNLEIHPYQRLFFTTFQYGDLTPFDSQGKSHPLSSIHPDNHILLFTGIASAAPLVDKLKEYTPHIIHLSYGDHHNFSKADLQEISKQFQAIKAENKLIVTTEKDAARLMGSTLDETIANNTYYIPIEVVFLQNQQKSFNKYITDYVSKNSRNRIVHQRTNVHKS